MKFMKSVKLKHLKDKQNFHHEGHEDREENIKPY